MTIHGVLHLLGFDHEVRREARENGGAARFKSLIGLGFRTRIA